MNENYMLPGQPMHEYLADRGRTSGSVLTMVEREPERYGRWLRGESVDRQTAAMGRGSYIHARLLEPDEVARSFAFYPSRNEATEEVMEDAQGPKGGKVKKATGRFEPQDASDAGRYLSMKRVSARAKTLHREFMAAHRGRTIVYPEDQPTVEAAVKAVLRHPEAAKLLRPDGFAPEVTLHWTCPETGELLQARPDGLREAERIGLELKSYQPRGDDDRLDTLDPSAVLRWARDGWGRKSAMIHDGLREITGDNWSLRWIVVEALSHEQLQRGWEPRVSVVIDEPEVDGIPSLYLLGRKGGGGVRGYIDLIGEAQRLREEGDFRAECVREVVRRWPLPGWLETELMLEKQPKAPPIKGARRVEVAHG
jgi:hypothetical protein